VFTVIALRNAQQGPMGVPELGLIKGHCKIAAANISRTADTIILSYDKEVTFDSWYLVTSRDDKELDPVVYEVHSSVDGTKWHHVASSANQFKCADTQSATRSPKSTQSISQEAMTSNREAERIFSFVDMSCLFPYYMITTGLVVYGSSLAIAIAITFVMEFMGLTSQT
jgi:hypothetical protein